MRIDPTMTELVYKTPVNKFVNGVGGRRYLVRPNAIMVDILPIDAEAWLAEGMARVPTADERQAMQGFFSDRSG